MSPSLASVAVVGSGVAGLMAAVALARRVPGLSVSLVDAGTGLEMLEDLIGASQPSLQSFHLSMGVVGGGLWRRIEAQPRLATRIQGLTPEPFFRTHGLALAGTDAPLHQLCAIAGVAPQTMGELALAAACAAPSTQHLRQGASASSMGYFLDLAAYREALRSLAVSAGVRFVPAAGLRVEPTSDGARIARLVLGGRRAVDADLFVDASGRAAVVRSALTDAWISWRASLPVDRLTVTRTDGRQLKQPFDGIVAHPRGWRYEGSGLSLEAEGADDADGASSGLRGALCLHQGRRQAPFFGNVVAIGAAAVALEPMAISGLDLICRHVDRLLALWPGRDIAQVERDLYNRGAGQQADHAHDFTRLHYALQTREEPFWTRARAAPLSEDLAHDLSLYAERGRLGRREGDVVTPEERILVLAGLGLRPRRTDTLSSRLNAETARAILRQIHRRLRAETTGFTPALLEPEMAKEAS